MFVSVVILCVTALGLVSGANILGIFSTPSLRHQAVFQMIWKELSHRGHKVTIITPVPPVDYSLVNLTEHDVKYSHEEIGLNPIFSNGLLPDQAWKDFLLQRHKKAFEMRMFHPDVRKLFKDNNVDYDVVLAEMIFPPVYAFSYKFNCPIIGLLSLPEILLSFKSTGGVVHPLLIPESFFGSAGNSNFWQRLWSTYAQIRLSLRFRSGPVKTPPQPTMTQSWS